MLTFRKKKLFLMRLLDPIDQFTESCSIGADFEKRYGKFHMKNHILSVWEHFWVSPDLLGPPGCLTREFFRKIIFPAPFDIFPLL